jgi:hypothetical protein
MMHGGLGASLRDTGMQRLFKVRWPAFAIGEALLLFAAVVVVGHKIPALNDSLNEFALAVAAATGSDTASVTWGTLAFLFAGPYLWAMLVADRLLRVRHGFAILSALAVAIWTVVAAALSPELTLLLRATRAGGGLWMSITGNAALAAACGALLIHARPLWIGVMDRGFIGLRLAARTHAARAGEFATEGRS